MAKFKLMIAALAALILTSCVSAPTGPPEKTPLTDVRVITETAPPAPAGPSATQTLSSQEPARNNYQITASLTEDRVITGIETMTYPNNTGVRLNEIRMNLYLNAFRRDSTVKPYFPEMAPKVFEGGAADADRYGGIDILAVTAHNEDLDYSVDGTHMRVTLDEPLPPGESVDISISFSAKIPLINHRSGADADSVWCANVFPLAAVYDGGWRNDPYYPSGAPFFAGAANFTVKLTAPADFTIIGSGEALASDSAGSKQTTFNARLSREFAFAALTRMNAGSALSGENVVVNAYTQPGNENRLAAGLLASIVAEAVGEITETVGAFPYQQLNVVEVGLFGETAVSYPGLIFVDSGLLRSGNYKKPLFAAIARQWFSNSVGGDPIKTPWLNGGLSTYLGESARLAPDAFDRAAALAERSLDERLAGSGLTLRSDLSQFTSWASYSDICETKAMLMIYNLRREMGAAAFSDFLKAYYAKNSFRTATEDVFIAAAEDACGKPLKDFFDEWLN